MIKEMLIKIIKSYKYFISPFLGQNCKYYPSCSTYFVQALEIKGLSGIWKGIWRILRCNPFSEGGYDPVRKEIREGK